MEYRNRGPFRETEKAPIANKLTRSIHGAESETQVKETNREVKSGANKGAVGGGRPAQRDHGRL